LKDNTLKGSVGRDIRRVVAPARIIEETGNSWNPVVPPTPVEPKKYGEVTIFGVDGTTVAQKVTLFQDKTWK
jgi:hypothetical protein